MSIVSHIYNTLFVYTDNLVTTDKPRRNHGQQNIAMNNVDSHVQVCVLIFVAMFGIHLWNQK